MPTKLLIGLNYVRLFKLLREINMCSIVLRLLIAMYISQMMQVKLEEVLSKQFPVGNEVKEGTLIITGVIYSISR